MSYRFVEGDTGSILEITCVESESDDTPISLAGSVVTLKWRNRAGVLRLEIMTITDAPNGIVQYQFEEDDLESPSMKLEAMIHSSGGDVTNLDPIEISVRKRL